MDRDGNIKVADFGIARAVNSSSGTVMKGNMLGSVHYFSPEQANGLPADEKSDLYSVGVVLYEMLTGQVPFDGETAVAVALKHIKEPPLVPSSLNAEVSQGLNEVILKALDKEREKRYQSAAEFATDLRRAIKMPMGGFIRKSADTSTRHVGSGRLKKMLLPAGLILLISAGILFGWRTYEKLATRVRVPDLLSGDIEDALAQLDALGLSHEISEIYDNEAIAGMIVAQDPSSGILVYPDSGVRLTVSKGKEAVAVPDVTNKSRSDAAQELESHGLMEGEIVLMISDAKPGTVVRQEPEAGEMAKPFSEITLFVSGECAEVPNLNGLTVELARSMLAASGFILSDDIQERLDEAEPGLVVSQSVEAGTRALIGEEISIVISQVIPECYYAETSVALNVGKDGDEILAMLTGPSGEAREVYREKGVAGNQTINLNLDSYEEGEQTLSVYINDELMVEKQIVFNKEQH